jgi:putative oxidoreductase
MGFLKQTEHSLQTVAFSLDIVLKIIPRLVIAAVFIPAGWGKLHSLARTIEYFHSINIPLATVLVPFVSVCELVCGFFILVGFYTRLSCIPLFIIMSVALMTAHRAAFTSAMSLVELPQALYAVILLCIFASGAGTFSLQQMFFRHK